MVRWRIELREAVRIDGDAVISFRGNGPARFRIQHARHLYGQPDKLGWCDCSAMSDASIGPQAAINKGGSVAVLVDYVDHNLDVRYRKFKADWLRVLPIDDEDEVACAQCTRSRLRLRRALRIRRSAAAFEKQVAWASLSGSPIRA